VSRFEAQPSASVICFFWQYDREALPHNPFLSFRLVLLASCFWEAIASGHLSAGQSSFDRTRHIYQLRYMRRIQLQISSQLFA
jgi:hypothetical protein